MVLLHPDTAHAGGPNRTCDVRKMVYFRVKVKALPGDTSEEGGAAGRWERVCAAHAVDPWADLPGTREALIELRRALFPPS